MLLRRECRHPKHSHGQHRHGTEQPGFVDAVLDISYGAGECDGEHHRGAAGHEHRLSIRLRHQRGPFPQDADGGEPPKGDKQPATDIGDANRQWRQHQRRQNPQRQLTARELGGAHRARWICFRHDHEPVCAISPPKRRSRRRYSAIAPSSVERSKSGQ